MGESVEVVADQVDGGVPLHFAVRREELGFRDKTKLHEKPLDRAIRYATDQGTEGDGNETQSERNSPFTTADMSHLEGGAAHENDENLHANFCT